MGPKCVYIIARWSKDDKN